MSSPLPETYEGSLIYLPSVLDTAMPSEYRESINVLVSVTDTTDRLVELVVRKNEIIAALEKLSELPLPVLERLADPNCG